MVVLSRSSTDRARALSRAASSSITSVDQPQQQPPPQEGGPKKGNVRKSGRTRLLSRQQQQQQQEARAQAEVEAKPAAAAAAIAQLPRVQVQVQEVMSRPAQLEAAQQMGDQDTFSCYSSIEWRKRTMLELFGDDTLPDQDDMEPELEECHTSASFTSPGESHLEAQPHLLHQQQQHGDAHGHGHGHVHANACCSGSGTPTPLHQELTSCSDSDHRYHPWSSSHRSSSNSASASSEPSRQQERRQLARHLRVELPQRAVKRARSDTCRRPSHSNVVSPHSVPGPSDCGSSGMDGFNLLLEVARGVSECECRGTGTGAGSASGSGTGMDSVTHSVQSPASPQPSQHSASTTATLQSRAKVDPDGVSGSATTHKQNTPRKRADGNTSGPLSARRSSPAAAHPPAAAHKESQCSAQGGQKRKNSGSPRIKEWQAVAAKDDPEDEECCADTSGPGLMPWNRMKAGKGLGSRRYRLLSSMLC